MHDYIGRPWYSVFGQLANLSGGVWNFYCAADIEHIIADTKSQIWRAINTQVRGPHAGQIFSLYVDIGKQTCLFRCMHLTKDFGAAIT